MFRHLLGRPVRAVGALLVAVLTMALVAVPMMGTANADTTAPTTMTATPSGGSTVTYTAPGTPLTVYNGQSVAIHVARTGTDNVFGIQARLCAGSADINNLIDFTPSQSGLCAPAALSAGTNYAVPLTALQPAGDAPTNTYADVTFVVGAGTTAFGGAYPDFTCGIGNPCQLVVRQSVSGSTPDAYQHFQLNYVAAPTAPLQPNPPTATPGDTTANVSWTAPGNGGSPITDYILTPYIGAVAQTPIDIGGTGTTKLVTGLTNFTAYTFKVHAVNAIGAGPDSNASAPVTPAPAPPVITGAQAGNGQVTLSWSAAGGSPNNYSVTSNPVVAPPAACTNITGLTCTFSGLTNGTSYTFVVTANYTGGTSPSAPGPAGGIAPLSNFGSVTQTFTLTKAAGQLVIGEACSGATGGPYPDKPYLGVSGQNCNIALGALVYVPAGGYYTTGGNLQPVTVRDQRDTDVGWHVDAALTAWTDAALDTFGACSTGLTPTAAGEGAVLPYTQNIVAGAVVAPDCSTATGGYGSTHTVMSATAGHGLGDSDLGGAVLVHVPLSAHSGTYSAVMTFTLFTN
ncbi:MAG TPA: fibronectin type III domain-containing protein [Mycobacterium sp.]|nr:fibronectin type III domain-containing protein [Mycobacterium sp.]